MGGEGPVLIENLEASSTLKNADVKIPTALHEREELSTKGVEGYNEAVIIPAAAIYTRETNEEVSGVEKENDIPTLISIAAFIAGS